MILFKKKFFRIFFVFLFFTGHGLYLKAADDTKDSLTVAMKKRANKAALMSAIVPGLGQAYNKKYWKIPIIYAGGVTLVYFITTNNSEYLKYKQAIVYRTDNDSSTVDNYPNYTNQDLTVRKDYYRRNRDLCYILMSVLYTLNIIDAYVDSQLLNFDVGDNLSLHTGGTINFTSGGIPVASLQLTFNFK